VCRSRHLCLSLQGCARTPLPSFVVIEPGRLGHRADAYKAGCANTVTPFNGEHNAGIQLLNTAQFRDDQGPLQVFVCTLECELHAWWIAPQRPKRTRAIGDRSTRPGAVCDRDQQPARCSASILSGSAGLQKRELEGTMRPRIKRV
jgi:hypothetical protein